MQSRSRQLALVCFALCFAGVLQGEIRAQDQDSADHESTFRWLRRRVPTFYEKRHSSVLSAYETSVSQARRATVSVESRGEEVALGAIVQSDGYVITKASELEGDLVCTLSDGRRLPAKLIGVQRRYDLAMLRIDAKNLPTITWSAKEAEIGMLVATSGTKSAPVSVGVVSVAARKIQAPSGVLGVLLEPHQGGARIERVIDGSSAEQAGLKAGDIITSVNGSSVATREELIDLIGDYQPGDHVRLAVSRGESTTEIHATLGDRSALHGQTPLYVQNTLGGPISNRRGGFPRAIQHDTVLEPNQCGGPVVDLEGRAIGINIARAGRVASYAVPAADVKSMLTDFIAGVYAPHGAVAEVKTASAPVGE